MDETDKAEFLIEVSAADTADEDIDRMTRQLLSELRQTAVESAELAKGGEVPRGAKSADAITMGSIVISALPTVLPAVIELVKTWAARGQGRTVKFKGRGIEFEGSADELQKLLATLEKGRRNT